VRGITSSPSWRERIEEGVAGDTRFVGGDPLPALPLARRGRRMWETMCGTRNIRKAHAARQ